MENATPKNSAQKEILETFKLLANLQKHILLEPAEKQILRSQFFVQNIRKKELVLRQGQACKKLFFVEQGSLRAYHLNEEGKEATIMFAVKDWWITDMYGFSNRKPALVSLEALEDSQVISLDFTAYEMLLEKIPKLERFFRILFQNAYVREQQRVLDTISLTTEERHRRFVVKYPQIVKRVTQKQIASYLGVTPEFLSAIKKKGSPS